jgi:hypothetical protein
MISSSSAGKNGWNISFRKMVVLLGGVLGALLFCYPLFSQGVFGRILGVVTDQSGGVVSGATVTVVDADRGVTKNLVTNDAGEYNAPNLTPGNYKVRAEAKGFKTIERTSIVLEVGKEVRVDLSLSPGSVAETMTITESVPLVETTNATLGGTLNNADINDMPLNGRNYQSLLSLRPGVMVQAGGGPWTQSTNGVRPDESAWMVDGVINANFFDSRPIAGMPSPITDGATILPIDAIQEFNLMENPKAEYGWKPGAIVNVGVKSGTNTLHGSAYGFYRSAKWDARNYFNPAPSADGTCPINPSAPAATQAVVCSKLPTQLRQFGGVVGGPIKKDKLFFFGGYEGLRSLLGNALGTSGVPETIAQTTFDPANSMVDAITALQTAGIPISPLSQTLTGCTVGPPVTCTGGLFPTNASQGNTGYISNFPNVNTTNNGVGKIDYHINGKNTLNGVVVIGNYLGDGEDHPFINKIFTDSFIIKTYTTSGSWVYSPTSTLVNEVRFGYNRMDFITGTDDATTTVPGLNTGLKVPGLPIVNIAGFAQFGTWHNRPQSIAPNPYYDFQESVSLLRGKHTFKFGYEWAHIEADSYIPDYGRGQIKFAGGQTAGVTGPGCMDDTGAAISCGLEDFFAGNPSGGKVLIGNPNRQMTWTSNAAFIQDDWRLNQKTTLNLGLRYEYKSPIREASNLWANFDPSSATGLVQQGQAGANTMWKPDHKDFSPRVGFAYDLTGKGTTVVRGGFSIMYSTFSAVMWMNQNQFQNSSSVSLAANPTGADIVTCPASCLAGGTPVVTPGVGTIQVKAASKAPSSWDGVMFPPAVGNIQCGDGVNGDPGPCSLMAVDPNLKTPYIINFNLGVQHSFGNNLSLEVGYVGNHGSRLTGFRDINQAPPTADGSGALPFSSKFPWFAFINQMSNDVRSNYNSVQATLTKRMSHGLSFIAGYTFGHGLDSGSLNRFALLPQNSNNIGAEYGNSDFDIRHRMTFTATYNLPGIKGFAQLLEGWQLNGILTLQSAQPWTVDDYGHNFSGAADNADRWDFFGNPSDFKGTNFTIPFCSGFGPGGDTSAVTCSQTASQTAATYNLSNPSALAAKCAAVAPDKTSGSSGGGTLGAGGCYVSGNSVMAPPAAGTFGTMGRNIFRDSGFRNMDFSVFKNFTFKERFGLQFRAEFFNILNHPIFANPYGASSGSSGGQNDPSTTNGFGGTIGTPDVNAGNPIVGSGAARDVQLGLKLTF